ncbi:hypothetical protein TELCIR_16129, partial [Teladorsagia circumcincta]
QLNLDQTQTPPTVSGAQPLPTSMAQMAMPPPGFGPPIGPPMVFGGPPPIFNPVGAPPCPMPFNPMMNM